MTSTIELSCNTLRCEIAPALGASVAGLWLGDTPVLRSTPASTLTTVRQAGSYPLVPFSNRLGHATLIWAGTSHPLVQATGDEPHVIHGVGWQRPWAVLEATAHFALLSYEHKPDAAWPFAFDASQGLDVDHCFDGWPEVVHLRDEVLHTRITPNLNRLVVYTSTARDLVAIEPVSHVNNAVNLMASTGASAAELGVCVLQPGQSMSAEMNIQVERVA